MSIETIHHAYNDVVASVYDRDPQEVTGKSLDRAVEQLRQQHFLGSGDEPLRVFDVGMGTGMFLAKLKAILGDQIQPFGIDLAENMVENALRKIPDLVAEPGDATQLERHFPGQTFDCVCTHFITGFVPMSVLAPKIWDRLEEGGYWSLVGGTKGGFPALQAKADSKILRWFFGAGSQKIEDSIYNPADQAEAERTLEAHGFEICQAETFEPPVSFRDLDEFLEFAYHGGWLTPIVEAIGLHKAGKFTRWLVNRFVLPVKDHHTIAIVLARKMSK